MPKFYQRYLTKSLAEVLDEALEHNPDEQIQVFEELALLREVAGQSVALYGVARDAWDNCTDPVKKEKLAATVVAAAQLLREPLNDVIKTADLASRIMSANPKDKLSVRQLHYFVEQVTRCAHEAMGEDADGIKRAERFKFLLDNRVRLPVAGDAVGTSLTPDMDAISMDATVPKEIIDIPLIGMNGEGNTNGNGHIAAG